MWGGGETVSHMGERSNTILVVLFGWGDICGHLHLIIFKCQGQSRYCRCERENKARRERERKKVPYMAKTSPSNRLCLQPYFPWHTPNTECKHGIAARVCVSGYACVCKYLLTSPSVPNVTGLAGSWQRGHSFLKPITTIITHALILLVTVQPTTKLLLNYRRTKHAR